MTQLEIVKALLGITDNSEDVIITHYLDSAKNIICAIRNSDIVETIYLQVQVSMAIELYNKRGAEGELSHDELGIGRAYENPDVSRSLIDQITPFCKTVTSNVRIIEV